MPQSKRVLLAALRAFIAVGTVAILLSLVGWAYPPAVMAALGILGGHTLCSAGDILRGADQDYRWQQARTKIAKSIKLKMEDVQGFHLWSTPQGDFWHPTTSDDVLPMLVAQQEVDLYGLAGHGVKAGDVVLDCGAHIGLYTRTALRAGAKLVVAIEPAPANLECLRRNLAAEIAAGKVIVYPKGVWDKEEQLPLYENPANTAGDSFVEKNGKITGYIPLTTIDKLVAELHLPAVNTIKMDIKGASEKALAGAAQTLRSYKPRVIISTEEAEDDPAVIARVVEGTGLGYKRACGSCTLMNGSVHTDVLFFY